MSDLYPQIPDFDMKLIVFINTSGMVIWKVPDGVEMVYITMWGGGGGGGYSLHLQRGDTNISAPAGGGGSGMAYINMPLNVSKPLNPTFNQVIILIGQGG